jgi:glyoxylase-like metal-dependent hydrolase (beta-lactamase superfamily II)
VVGPGAASLINGTRELINGSHSHFEKGILDLSRTIELPSPDIPSTPPSFEDHAKLEPVSRKRCTFFSKVWRPKGLFQHSMDIFGDGSLYIISAPGHLDGHINLLCRKTENEYVYLAADACHDQRLLSGEKHIATWTDPAYPTSICCIHVNKEEAEKTIEIIRATMENPGELGNVEVVFAHDASWDREAKKLGKFFPGSL